ncbi:unnamed protein product [Clavelina lepadiformis]|uniref:Metallo-beta-lactamase domain-containing protein n=1 Tax=Clavelina lepadiformis TaxID=159417 RepID=A0ABP0FFV3_CLALP
MAGSSAICMMVVLAAVTIGLLQIFSGSRKSYQTRNEDAYNVNSASFMEEREKFFNDVYGSKRIVKVRDGVHVAIGYALANVILLEGIDGFVMVDCTESSSVAVNLYKEFRKMTKKPLKGIIITHSHADHITGASAILKEIDSADKIPVFMHSSSAEETKLNRVTSGSAFKRASRQFGIHIEPKPKMTFSFDSSYPQVEATHTYDKEATYEIAGMTIQSIHTPGETHDHTTVWLPEWKVVLPADNIYEMFPNMYTLRGIPPRKSEIWLRSLDRVRSLGAEHMIPSHTRPVSGKEEVDDTLTHYRDAIQFVQDQTLRYINQGLSVEEIVEKVQLPASLARHPFLKEYYGTVAWTVRGIYTSYLGWFNGDPVNLNPLSNQKRGKRLIKLLDAEKILQEARKSLELSLEEFKKTGYPLPEELQWALELSSYVSNANPSSSIFSEAKEVKVAALKALGTISVNTNAKNYYLTCARELEDLVIKMDPDLRKSLLMLLKVEDIMAAFPIRFKAEECDDKLVIKILFNFTDVKQNHLYTMRHCVLEYEYNPNAMPSGLDAKLVTTSTIWKEILTNKRSAVGAYATGDIAVEGSMITFKRFMDLLAKE